MLWILKMDNNTIACDTRVEYDAIELWTYSCGVISKFGTGTKVFLMKAFYTRKLHNFISTIVTRH